jgi:hypothetical protein
MRDFYITKVGSNSLKFAQQLKQPTTIQLNALKQACLTIYKTYSETVIFDFKKNFGDKEMTYAPISITATSQELGYTSYRKVRENL